MIEKLNEEQVKQLDVYRDKWLSIGLDTARLDRRESEHWLSKAYINAGEKPPKFFLKFESPLGVAYAVLFIEEIYYKILKGQKVSSEGEPHKINKTVAESMLVELKRGLPDIDTKVFAQASDFLFNKVTKGLWDKLNNILNSFIYGSHDASWLSFYNYFLEVCSLDVCAKLTPLMEYAKIGGWAAPFEHACLYSEKPLEIHFNKQNVLHNDTKPAILYADGFATYALNGIIVPKELVLTPADDLDADKWIKTVDVEVRREFIRKYGVVKLEKLGTLVDSYGGYKLIDMNSLFSSIPYAPHLFMENASLKGVWHAESVPPTVRTVEDALIFRNGTKEKPIILT